MLSAYKGDGGTGPDRLQRVLAGAGRSAPEDGTYSEVERRARKLKHLMAFYEQHLPAQRRQLLSLVALFRVPVETAVLAPLARKLPGVAETFAGASDADIERGLIALVHEHLLSRQPGPTHDQPAFAAHPILRDYFRESLLKGRGELANDFAEVLVGQPGSKVVQSLSEIQPVMDAIEILLEASVLGRAKHLYDERLQRGQIFRWLPAPYAGMRCALGFVSDPPRRKNFSSGSARLSCRTI